MHIAFSSLHFPPSNSIAFRHFVRAPPTSPALAFTCRTSPHPPRPHPRHNHVTPRHRTTQHNHVPLLPLPSLEHKYLVLLPPSSSSYLSFSCFAAFCLAICLAFCPLHASVCVLSRVLSCVLSHVFGSVCVAGPGCSARKKGMSGVGFPPSRGLGR